MKRRSFLKWTLFGALSLAPVAASWGQPAALAASGVIPDRYIVLLKPGVAHARVAARHGLAPDLVYTHALNGFAGAASPAQLRRLQRDADVAWIEPDQVVSIAAAVSGKPVRPPPGPPPQPAQVNPTGIFRIGGVFPTGPDCSAVGIAIIDTGIELTHPDLNVQGNVTFVRKTRSGNDDNGHGTHCAGTAAAKDNAIGVVGVAPNARLYAVKVLARDGTGFMSWMIAGIDWVTTNAAPLGIKVANVSVGGVNSPSLNAAISTSVAAGVAYCVAAGNEGTDASAFSPANCPDALAVSAIVDTDGFCGALYGASTAYGADDTFANFSNFGEFVHIAAPGVNIYSTYKGATYATMTGTSMAAPHVAGAAARYFVSHPGVAPAEVYAALIAAGTPQASACGFTGDADGIPEPLVNVSGL